MRKKRDSKYTTIKDVAKEAGVSIATVSRVINNGIVKEDKRKKVLAAIKKLNYVPNDSARNLASVSKTKNIYLLVPNRNTGYYLDFIKGFKSVLKIYSYNSTIDFYEGKEDYENYLQINSLSSEFKAFVELGEFKNIDDKIIINWLEEHVLFNVKGNFEDLSVYTKDDILVDFLKTRVFKNLKTYDENQKSKKYLAPALNEAIALYNKGIREDIYTFSDASEISKVCPNIKKMKFDFFGFGITLARIAMKMIREEEVIKIELNVGE